MRGTLVSHPFDLNVSKETKTIMTRDEEGGFAVVINYITLL